MGQKSIHHTGHRLENSGSRVRIFLSAGEVSGDLIGANLAKALQSAHPRVVITGVGGAEMEKAGVHVFFKSNHLGTVGLSEAFDTIPEILNSFLHIRRHLLKKKPDLAVLIGHDVFHLALSCWIRAGNIPTVSYFPPQVWLWRRIVRVVARSYDWILTSFGQEESVYKKAGARTIFVGHYLRDRIDTISPEMRQAARDSLGVGMNARLLTLLPGSRLHELNNLMPVLLGAAREMKRTDASIRFVLPIADPYFEKIIQGWICRAGLETIIQLSYDSREAMAASDLAICCSGTATLEATLMELPMIIIYKGSRSSWLAVRMLDATGFIESKTLGLPNLLAGERIVPEMIQYDLDPKGLAREAMAILRDPARQSLMKANYRALKRQLGEKGGMARAAGVILKKALRGHRGRTGNENRSPTDFGQGAV